MIQYAWHEKCSCDVFSEQKRSCDDVTYTKYDSYSQVKTCIETRQPLSQPTELKPLQVVLFELELSGIPYTYLTSSGQSSYAIILL
jgi:hypothetical protein